MENKENLLFIPSSSGPCDSASRKEQLELWKQKKHAEKVVIKPSQKGLSSRFLDSKQLTQRKPSGPRKLRTITELTTPSTRQSQPTKRTSKNPPLSDNQNTASQKPQRSSIVGSTKERVSLGAEGRKILSIEKRVETYAPVLNEEFETLLAHKLNEVSIQLKEENISVACKILDQVEKWGIVEDAVSGTPTEQALQKKKTSARKKIIEGMAEYWVQRARLEESRENYPSVIDLYELALQMGAKPPKVLEQGLKAFLLRIMPSAAYSTVFQKTRRMSVSPAFLLDLEKEEREFTARTSLPVAGLVAQLATANEILDQTPMPIISTQALAVDDDDDEGEWEDVPHAQDSDEDSDEEGDEPEAEQRQPAQVEAKPQEQQPKTLPFTQLTTPVSDRRNPFTAVESEETFVADCDEHDNDQQSGSQVDDVSTTGDRRESSISKGLQLMITPKRDRRYHHACKTPGLPRTFISCPMKARTPIRIPPVSVIGTPSKVSRTSILGAPAKILTTEPLIFSPHVDVDVQTSTDVITATAPADTIESPPRVEMTSSPVKAVTLPVEAPATPVIASIIAPVEESSSPVIAKLSSPSPVQAATPSSSVPAAVTVPMSSVPESESESESDPITVPISSETTERKTCNTPEQPKESDRVDEDPTAREALIEQLSNSLQSFIVTKKVDQINCTPEKIRFNQEEQPTLSTSQQEKDGEETEEEEEFESESEEEEKEEEKRKPTRKSISSRGRAHLLTPQKVQADLLQSMITPSGKLGRYQAFIPLKNAPQTEAFSSRRKSRITAGNKADDVSMSSRKKSIVVTPVRRSIRLSNVSRLPQFPMEDSNLFLQPNIFLPFERK